MKLKTFIFSVMSFCSFYAFAENKFFIENFAIAAGESKEIELCLTNDVAFSAFQADIYLPEGLTIFQEDGEYIFDLSSRKYRNHTIAASAQNDGAIRILSYSTTSKEYSGNEGALVYCTIIADDNFSGTHQIEIKNIVFTQADETEYKLDATTTIVTGPAEEIEISEFPVTIKDFENGQITLFVNSGNTAKFKFEAIENWSVNSVIINGVDITNDLDADGLYVTDAITEATTINVTYRSNTVNITSFTDDNVKVSGHDGYITITGVDAGNDILIYNVDGVIVNTTKSDSYELIINLPSDNVYIVKYKNSIFKVRL